MSIRVTLFTYALTCSVALAGEGKFTTKPSAKMTRGKTTISFTVSAPTNVEVSVLDAKGKVVRHLAAGVLGAKTPPPPPLKAGLSQSVEWDGKTDASKKAAGGPFKVQVRLGMRAELDGFVGESKYWIGALCGLATDPKGNLYVYSSSVGVHRGSSRYLQIFDRKGDYRKTIMPMPVDLPPRKLKPFGVIPAKEGGFYPNNYYGTWPEFYPGGVGKIVPRVTADGVITIWDKVNSIMRVSNDGIPVSNPLWRTIWTKRMAKYGLGGPKVLAPSPDGKTLYLSGFCKGAKRGSKAAFDPAWPDGRIYRMDVSKPDGIMTKFVDLPNKNARSFSGYNTGYCGIGTGGAVCDKDGNLLVADRMNKRLRVFSPAGKEIGGFAIEWPQHVMSNHKTGEVYILTSRPTGYCRVEKFLLKFSSWKDGKLLAKLTFKENGYHASAALDDSAKPAVIWAAGDLTGKRALLRVEDRGGELVVTRNLMDLNTDRFGVKPRMAVHPETDMVICNNGNATLNGYDGLSGKRVKLPLQYGADMTVGLDGNWYIQTGKGYSGPICRFDKNMKAVPVPGKTTGKNQPPTNSVGAVYGRMGAGFCTVGMAADQNGRCYSMQMFAFAPYCVTVFGADGKPEKHGRLTEDPRMKKCPRFKSAIIGPIDTQPGGLQLDWGGNIYVGSALRPVDHQPPADFAGNKGYQQCVGGIIKFKPQGGAITRVKAKTKPSAPLAGKKGLFGYQNKRHGGYRFIENAAHIYPELGCVSGNWGDGCMCRMPMFQVDGWGRLFIPNAITCSVRIVDNAGNLIQQFGKYGNIDSRGPGEDSMIKTPAVPLGWPEAVGASYKAVYVSDVVNRRIVRFKKVYAAEETCAVQ